LRAVAERDLAADRETELLVFGHSHVATLERMPSGGVYANAGNWMDDTTFLRIEPGVVELRRWTGSGDGERIGVQPREGGSATVTSAR
jgi:UDP-2,3-diacylglucosamine pyrophosphatase LpxH